MNSRTCLWPSDRVANAEATKPALIKLRAHLAIMPGPAFEHAAPQWTQWTDRHGEIEPDQDPAYLELHRVGAERVRLTRSPDAKFPDNW